MLVAGDIAPDFELESTAGHRRSLSSLRGSPVVVYFYPEDHTAGCTMEAQQFRDYFEALSLHQAAILGISRDTMENHCSFRDQNALPFELLSDPDAAVHDLYGAWRERFLGGRSVRRCTFLVGPDGKIAKIYTKVTPAGHARQVVNDLERIGHRDGWFLTH